ncbi:ABC transporter permease [Streptomyces chartreusis]|uniref:ABC transporter permease n=1 Tax=Streptomyces chartreusis TaxID=1969 RepID=A0A7H8TC30_STRCX|nr:ABC transporter permease [Streptomyces chartreusis]QKZ21075.1 ABC transporter permease [Streptomyces chartreusis]
MVLLLVIVTFAMLPESGAAFRSPENIRAVLANQAVGLTVAIALLFPMAAGYFDFSVGAVTATCSVVAATSLSKGGFPLPLAVLAAIIVGAAVGLFLGVLVAVLDMNAFIATLGTATLLGGLIFAYTGGLQITSGIPASLTELGSLSVLGVPRIAVLATLIAAVCWFVMGHTPFGRQLFAIGSNARAAALVGVRVIRVRLLSFAVSGTVAGIAGVLLLARQGAATSDNGMTMLFPALTAVLLSTIMLELGRPSVAGTVVAILLVAVSVSGLTLLGAPAWVGPVFDGAALLAAVSFTRLATGGSSRS